jgi:hypothetical protein
MTEQVKRLYSLQEHGLLSDRTPAFLCCVDRCLPHHPGNLTNHRVVTSAEDGEDFLRRHKGCRTFVQWSGRTRK